jgi:hypothetical protein
MMAKFGTGTAVLLLTLLAANSTTGHAGLDVFDLGNGKDKIELMAKPNAGAEHDETLLVCILRRSRR